MLKNISLLITLLSISALGMAQVTLIPDPVFEQFLIDQGVDTDGMLNGQVFTVDIEDETILAIIQNSNIFNFINDLTGIQDFESLEALQIYQMPISELDLSQNIQLKSINLDDLALDELDVSNNTNLESINLSLNSASDMFSGDISEIDLSNNLLLESVNIGDSFEVLNLSNASNLNFVDLVFSPTLRYLNIKNGNNNNLDFVQLENNPNLECFQVDDPDTVIAGTDPPYDSWVIANNNPTMIITDDCGLGLDEYLDEHIVLYPNPVSDKLFISTTNGIVLEQVSLYNKLGQLLLSKRAITQLDISNLNAGVYTIILVTKKGVLTKEIIKL